MSEATLTSAELPRWDVSGIFPSLESPEFGQAFERLGHDIDELVRLFDQHGVGSVEEAPAAEAAAASMDAVLRSTNEVLRDMWTLTAYVYAFISTDSRDEVAQARMSELRQREARLTKLEARLTAWLGRLEVDDLIERSEIARGHSFALRRAREAARHLMPLPLEELAADLDLTGASAWSRLYSDVTSQVQVPWERGGEEREIPISELRNLALDPDRDVRQRGYEVELAAWERVSVPLAAALNSVKGQTDTLARRRDWGSALDAALFENHIDRETLDAMFTAIRESFPELRRYLKAKARALGLPALTWYDLRAPVSSGSDGNGRRAWEFGEAETFILEQFGSYSDALRDYAGRVFRERWIDAEPRIGKADGGFCMYVRGEESRILVNYAPAYDGVATLAHELGHAYHDLVLSPLTPIQRRTPMTLAETASTFCETIVRNAALAQASPAEQLEIVEGSLQSNLQVTMDITSRFLFENRVFERRAARELSVDELCELMLEAQRETYGDGLDGQALHPYAWAAKPHYYFTSFYNFPYAFGLLFGLGLYAWYERDPQTFRENYDSLLASTGSADAAELAARFDVDLRTPDFWRSSLKVVLADVDRFAELAGQLPAEGTN